MCFIPSEFSLSLKYSDFSTETVQTNIGCSVLFNSLPENSKFYFLHSYFFNCKTQEDSIATTDYGIKFTSAIQHNNISGVQFHPEKSHGNGVKVLTNFWNI